MKNKIIIKMLKNFLFFSLLIFLTFWFIFRKQNMKELYNTITSANVLYLLIAIGIMILYHLTEAYNLRQLLVAFGERKISIFKALKFTFIGFFFSSITPASTGGQPLEIYYMSKEEISAPTSTISLLVILNKQTLLLFPLKTTPPYNKIKSVFKGYIFIKDFKSISDLFL